MRRFAVGLLGFTMFLGLAAPMPVRADTTSTILTGVKLLIKYREPIQKAIEPFLQNEEGKTQEVFPFATLKTSRLIVSEQQMDVSVVHWHQNVFGRVEMKSTVPYKLLYSIDLGQVRCRYSANSRTLYVVLPPADIEAGVTDNGKIQRSYSFTGMRGLKQSGIKLHFERFLLSDAKAEANRSARKRLPAIDEIARDSLRPFLSDVVRGIDADIRVQIEN